MVGGCWEIRARSRPAGRPAVWYQAETARRQQNLRRQQKHCTAAAAGSHQQPPRPPPRHRPVAGRRRGRQLRGSPCWAGTPGAPVHPEAPAAPSLKCFRPAGLQTARATRQAGRRRRRFSTGAVSVGAHCAAWPGPQYSPGGGAGSEGLGKACSSVKSDRLTKVPRASRLGPGVPQTSSLSARSAEKSGDGLAMPPNANTQPCCALLMSCCHPARSGFRLRIFSDQYSCAASLHT